MIPYRYDLTPESMDCLERMITDFTRDEAPDIDVVGVVVGYNVLAANFGRTGEQNIFDGMGEGYDFPTGMAPHEARSEFLYTVDQRPVLPEPKIIHVQRMVAPRPEIGSDDWDGLTGIEMVDDRILATDTEEHMSLDELLDASNMTIKGLKKSLNVATNYITGRTQGGYSLGQLGTVLSYHFLVDHAHNKEVENIIAYQNRAAEYSIERLGAERQLLGGKRFHLPRTAGGFDTDYTAYIIPGSKANLDLFLGRDKNNLMAQMLGMVSRALVEYPKP